MHPTIRALGLTALSIALYLVIAGMVLVAIAAFSSGFGPGRDVAIGIMIAAATIGAVHGLWMSWRAARKPESASIKELPTSTGDAIVDREHATATNTGSAVSGLWWLGGTVLGMVLALMLTIAVSRIASLFRGPIIGVWELGTPRYARDQTMVDLGRAVAIFIIGGVTGFLLIRVSRETRGLGLGLIIGSAGFGLFALLAK